MFCGRHVYWDHKEKHMATPESYLGWTVEVHYLNYSTVLYDKAVLTAVEPGWITLTRYPGQPREEHLLIPLTAIRLLKPVEPPDSETHRLLRPVGAEELEAAQRHGTD